MGLPKLFARARLWSDNSGRVAEVMGLDFGLYFIPVSSAHSLRIASRIALLVACGVPGRSCARLACRIAKASGLGM
jgi:hypothetical protein